MIPEVIYLFLEYYILLAFVHSMLALALVSSTMFAFGADCARHLSPKLLPNLLLMHSMLDQYKCNILHVFHYITCNWAIIFGAGTPFH